MPLQFLIIEKHEMSKMLQCIAYLESSHFACEAEREEEEEEGEKTER